MTNYILGHKKGERLGRWEGTGGRVSRGDEQTDERGEMEKMTGG